MKTLIQNLSIPGVRTSGKITWAFAVFIIFILPSFFEPANLSLKKTTDHYYVRQLQLLKEKLKEFRSLSQKNATVPVLRQKFFQSRLVYKKMAVITEYFNIYETKFLNSPAIDRIEEDYPDKIISPAGFQAIELLLFSSWNAKSYTKLSSLLGALLNSISRLENEPDRSNKFRDELVWDALRSATIRLLSTGITGFDSPSAFYSLPEAKATLAGISDILLLFKNDPARDHSVSFTALGDLLKNASTYLSLHNDFNHFDRLYFTAMFLNPLYSELVKTRVKLGIGTPEGNNPVNYNAATIFSADAFNINFFTPGNTYGVTAARIELGKKLFSDSILSGNNNRSCASCHRPEKAFSDGLKTPFALNGESMLSRNTPTLLNSALQTKQFLDSRADILENQLDEVVHNEKEMSGSLKNSALRLKSSPVYNKLFQDAYADIKDPVTPFTIANSISSYIRSLVTLNSRFDQYMRGNKTALSASEKNGFNLFAGRAKCATCHFIPLFNGLVPPVFTETESEILGVPATKNKNPAVLDADPGKFNFTKSVIHQYAFKTPTLRNIELTAPYMHNGVYNTLEEVMDFYNNGGGKGLKIAPPNQSLPFDRLQLSKKEIADIIQFMKSLTDTSYYIKPAG